MKEYVSVPARKQPKGEYTKYAAECLVKSLPRAVSPSAQMLELSQGFKFTAKESAR